MAQSDPTDHVLAAIASILDSVETSRESQKPGVTAAKARGPSTHTRSPSAHRSAWIFQDWSRADGRDPLQRAVREAGGEYYVDETIGVKFDVRSSGPH